MIVNILVGYIYLQVWAFSWKTRREIPLTSLEMVKSQIKLREESDSLSSLSDEVLADGLNSPELAKLLVSSLRNIEAQVKDLFKVNEEIKISQIKLRKSLDALWKKIDELETEIKNKNEKVLLLENRVEILEEEKESQGKEIDDLEQYSRRNCLLLHGVVETNAECTDDIIIKTCAEELGIDVKQEDLDRSHRLGKVKRNDNKPRPIIVKFARYAVRNKVFSNKKKLKGKKLLITESLTVYRMKLLDEARQKYGVRNVWTYDGRVMYKENNKISVYKK